MTQTKCGFIAIIGRPNAGKSTLMNALLGQKVVITSRKPQTTRHTILGIKTEGNAQAIYVDTPGFRDLTQKALHRCLNKAASNAVFDVDLLLWVVDITRWTEDDEAVLALLKKSDKPVILILNKIDEIKDKTRLLPIIENYQTKHHFEEIVPLSALKKKNLEGLNKAVNCFLPAHEFMYEEDQLTDKSDRFIIAEIIREKLMRKLGQEVPYSTAVEIELIEDETSVCRISAILWVERPGQKIIVIGKKGANLKIIGTDARVDIEAHLKKKVFLKLWVKVRENWSDNEKMLHQFGYTGDV
jgi:GTPase